MEGLGDDETEGPSAGADAGADAGQSGVSGAGGMGGSGGGAPHPMDAGAADSGWGGAGGAGGAPHAEEGFIFDEDVDLGALASGCEPLPGGPDICDVAACGFVPSCCVGDGTCCVGTEPAGLPKQLDFSACAGKNLATCLGDNGFSAETFGPLDPAVRTDAFYPGGDDSGDSGLRFDRELDLSSQRVILAATFHAADDCGVDCLEGVGFGFLGSADIPLYVTGDVSLIYSGSLDEVRLTVGGVVAGRTELSGDSEKWKLEVRPTGEVLAFRGDDTETTAFEALHTPTTQSRLVLFGRNRDPETEVGARITNLAVEVEQCDIPEYWRERSPLVIRKPNGNEWEPATPMASPSVAYDDDGKAALAFEVGGAIYFANRPGSDPLLFDLTDTADRPALSKTAIESATGLRDPWLMREDKRWTVYFVADGESGAGLYRSQTTDGASFTVPSPVEVYGGIGALAAMTIARDIDGKWVMVAREDDDANSVGIFESDDGVTWYAFYASSLNEFVGEAAGRDTDGFGLDGIDAPALIVHNGAARLYYAVRRGTRWAIDLMVSDRLVGFRQVPDARPVLRARGTGFDRHSVTDPNPVFHDGVVELFYVGSDGYRSRLGRAWRSTIDG
jgi:hypothetical protein